MDFRDVVGLKLMFISQIHIQGTQQFNMLFPKRLLSILGSLTTSVNYRCIDIFRLITRPSWLVVNKDQQRQVRIYPNGCQTRRVWRDVMFIWSFSIVSQYNSLYCSISFGGRVYWLLMENSIKFLHKFLKLKFNCRL